MQIQTFVAKGSRIERINPPCPSVILKTGTPRISPFQSLRTLCSHTTTGAGIAGAFFDFFDFVIFYPFNILLIRPEQTRLAEPHHQPPRSQKRKSKRKQRNSGRREDVAEKFQVALYARPAYFGSKFPSLLFLLNVIHYTVNIESVKVFRKD